jgi:GNAT superfamily N-acetyltransferase
MKQFVRAAQAGDAPVISALVQESFTRFVAPDWEPRACDHFMHESSVERFAASIPQATYAAVAQAGSQLVGFILMPTPARLAFLFVRPAWVRRGVASQLWEAARGHVEAHHPAIKTVELNSSPYAVAAYRALGFYPISEPFRRGGCLATRMACWLPGRSLAQAERGAEVSGDNSVLTDRA